MKIWPTVLCLALILRVDARPGEAFAGQGESALNLLFWQKEDVTNTFGKLVFGAEPLQPGPNAEGFPNMQFGCEAPQRDGTVRIYGWRMAHSEERERRALEIVRCVTRDGLKFSNTEALWSQTNKDWQGFANLVYRPTDRAVFLFAWAPGALHVFRSADGRGWRPLTQKAYTDHDAMCVTWYPPFGEFLNYQNTLEAFPKRYPDNIGAFRRVLSFRRSRDGVQWESFSPPFLKGEKFWAPDSEDPADLEFYRSVVFSVQGRYAMLLQDYLAPPPEANSRRAKTKHGPRSQVEWAISPDGLNWRRPFRETDATENTGGLPVQGPLLRDGVIRFYSPDGKTAILLEDRIFYMTCRANGEFSTPEFTMPSSGLFLNANARYSPLEGETGRAYVMAELRDEHGEVVPGFERSQCLIANQDGHAIPLRWAGASASALAGRKVRIRFFLRDAKIYGVTGKTR